MSKLMLILLVALGLVMGAGVLAYQYGGVLGLVGAIVAIFFALKFVPKLAGLVMMKSLMKAMDAQGESLRGATIEVHEVTSAPKPDPNDYDTISLSRIASQLVSAGDLQKICPSFGHT